MTDKWEGWDTVAIYYYFMVTGFSILLFLVKVIGETEQTGWSAFNWFIIWTTYGIAISYLALRFHIKIFGWDKK